MRTIQFAIIVCFSFIALPVLAQRDTTKQSIDITSSYKPVLRNAVKINFSGSQLLADTSRQSLKYNIPAQNLFYAYQPVSLKPLALAQDTSLYLGSRHFVKAGFGSYSTPYVSAGLSFGDGKKSLVNLYGSYIASKGDIKNQDYSNMNLKATGSFFTQKNEIYGSLTLRNDNYYLYGYDHKIYDYPKDAIRRQYQDVTATAGFRNTASTAWRINYDPNVKVNFFLAKDLASETNVMVNLPVEKKIGEQFNLRIDFKGEFTNYTTIDRLPSNITVRNNLIQLSPSLQYSKPLLKVSAGITPVWNQGEYTIMPNIFFEAQLQEKVFMIQGGWVGRYVKNTFRHLTNINPFLDPLVSQQNTREVELYGGIKGSLGQHFNFNAKASFITYNDMLLFIKDTSLLLDSPSFVTVSEPTMNNLRIHGDISYIMQDKFTLNAGFTLNGYTGIRQNVKAWNTLPFEATGSLRWWAFKKLMLKGDLYMFGGSNDLDHGTVYPMEGGFDLSAGAEYKINKNFSAWLDINNLLNDKYERWRGFPVYGINLLGGIIIRF